MRNDKPHFADADIIESLDSCCPTRILVTLFKDCAAGRNIVWTDDECVEFGDGFIGDNGIAIEKITNFSSGAIKPHIAKKQGRRFERIMTRAGAIVPSWLFNRMNNSIDAVWLDMRDVSYVKNDVERNSGLKRIVFHEKSGRSGRVYVESHRPGITCGEASFAYSHYDTVTMDASPVGGRIGFSNRMLCVVSEKIGYCREWVRWAPAAPEASSGFEFQCCCLPTCINVFGTFWEHQRERWSAGMAEVETGQTVWILLWNILQLNGPICTMPANQMDIVVQFILFDYEELVQMHAKLANCFDYPNHIFAGLWIKSRLCITEITKRLYNDDKVKKTSLDDRESLNYILEEHVFGIVLPEIVYQIVASNILGASGEVGENCGTNFIKADSVELAERNELVDGFIERMSGRQRFSDGNDESSCGDGGRWYEIQDFLV